jgi:hypothetical protein
MAAIALLPRCTRHALLKRRETLVLDNAQGTLIAVDRGCVWVTLEHDLRDIVLARGMRFQVDRRGRTIIAAEADTRLRLLSPLTLRERAQAWLRRAAAASGRYVRGLAQARARRFVPYA